MVVRRKLRGYGGCVKDICITINSQNLLIMALQILEKNEIFYAKGTINTSTKRNFISHFDHVLNDRIKIILNIDAVEKIDADGLKALKNLIKIAEGNNKTFFITGKGGKEIYEDYQTSQIG